MSELEKKLYAAVICAINEVGLVAFKQTSLFLAGRRKLS
jgi:hypothetical protein